MSSIRITSVPPGFAPGYIRRQWVKLTLPLATAEEIAQDPPSGFRIGTDNIGGHLVLRERAVDALLEADKLVAAEFWSSPVFGRFLEFKKDVCELVE